MAGNPTGHLIVGIGHRQGVGKDTLAEMLRNELSLLGVTTLGASFAYRVKHVACEMYGWGGLQRPNYYDRHRELRSVVLPKIGKTPREIWIELGTLVARTIHPDTWVEMTANDILASANLATARAPFGTPVVTMVADVRFPNEVVKIRELGGILIRVDRDSVTKSGDPADSALDGYQGWDITVANHGTLQDLQSGACELAKLITTPLAAR